MEIEYDTILLNCDLSQNATELKSHYLVWPAALAVILTYYEKQIGQP